MRHWQILASQTKVSRPDITPALGEERKLQNETHTIRIKVKGLAMLF